MHARCATTIYALFPAVSQLNKRPNLHCILICSEVSEGDTWISPRKWDTAGLESAIWTNVFEHAMDWPWKQTTKHTG